MWSLLAQNRGNYKYKNGSYMKEQLQPQFCQKHVKVYYVNLTLLFCRNFNWDEEQK